jgi:multisubunit Na+/H+ antiporter MnhB subunit
MIEERRKNQFSRMKKTVAVIGVLTVTIILGWTAWTLPSFSDQMLELVSSNLAISGVENPVTAVLLNFRAYDTLLEVGVLLLAALGVLSMSPSPVRLAESNPSPILRLLSRVLLPFIILVAGYLLWIGKYAPGGAFQAGAVLAAGGILLVTSVVRFDQLAIKIMPFALVIGLQTFLLVALATMIFNVNFLQYPLNWADDLILVIEAAATVSIGATLTVLFIGGSPDRSAASRVENDRFEFCGKENKIK